MFDYLQLEEKDCYLRHQDYIRFKKEVKDAPEIKNDDKKKKNPPGHT